MKSLFSAHLAATRRASAVAAGVVVFLLLLPPLQGHFFFGEDLTRINLSVICAIQDCLTRHASLDLSPLLGNGGPLLARPDAALYYPPRWVALALSPDWAVAFEVILHLGLAAATAAWLARTFGVRAFTAACVGIAFGLSGTVIDLLRHAHYMVAAAWLPLIWAGTRELLRWRGGRASLLAVFGGLAGCLLGAEPQAFAVGVGVIGVELLTAAVRRRRRPNRRWLALALAVVAGFAVGLVQWAPTLGEMALTPRAHNLSTAEALAWSFGPPEWIGVILPGMPCRYVEGVTNLFAMLRPGDEAPWNKTPYLGPLVVLAALVGFGIRRARSAAVVALGATVLSLGDQSPVVPVLIKVLPFLTRFRSPSKYWLIASLAILVLAAITLDAIGRHRVLRRRLALGGGILAGALIVLAGWVRLNAGELDLAARRIGQPLGGDPLPSISTALFSSTLEALAPLAIALALLLHPRLRRRLFGLVSLSTIAALPYALLLGPALSREGGQPSALGPTAAPVVCLDPSVINGIYPLSSGNIDWLTMRFLRTHLLPETQACAGVRSAIPYSPLTSTAAISLDAGMRRHNTAAIRAFGCTHFVAQTRFGPELPTRETRFEVPASEAAAGERNWGGATVYELPDPIPRVFVARDPSLSTTEGAAVARVAKGRSSQELLGVVDDPLHRLGSTALPSGAEAREAEGDDANTSAVSVRVGGSGGAVVGVRTPFLVGWQAAQAGHALPVVRIAAYQLGAIVEDVGAGPIVFQYRPPHLTLGFSAGGAGALLLIVGLWLVGSRRRAVTV